MEMADIPWTSLLRRIHDDRCTPFLGSELAVHAAPKRSELAREIAEDPNNDYPLDDKDNLPRVTQYITTKVDRYEAEDQVLSRLKNVPVPDFSAPDSPHGILARLPLSIYITTSYDTFMYQALCGTKPFPRAATTDYCRWNPILREAAPLTEARIPNPANPLVFHLYGSVETPTSLVLTEDDYLDYLLETSFATTRLVGGDAPSGPIPATVLPAFIKPCLLFLGYRLDDLEFRVLLRTIAPQLTKQLGQGGQRLSIQLVQTSAQNGVLTPEERRKMEERLAQVQEYLARYCQRAPFDIRVYWVSTQEFLRELGSRCAEYRAQQATAGSAAVAGPLAEATPRGVR